MLDRLVLADRPTEDLPLGGIAGRPVQGGAAEPDGLARDQDPLGVDSRWSLVRGQLEPLVWAEIDALLASFSDDSDDVS